LPNITRDKIILPEGLLKRIERQSVDTTKYRDAMVAAGRRLKRGLLLHGSPGTGKTLTAMYLASQMEERTILIMTGRGMGLLEQTCAMARRLEPAMIIIEDVDLIGEERSKNQCTTPILFELLNQMDGLADDCDVMFLLTTNRPDILEPALAARPGRIDQAFKVPLPDAECRQRLFDLYAENMTVRVKDMKSFIRRTDGASAAFINELMRKAALFAAPDAVPIVVEDRHMEEALHELAVEGGSFTRSLLGFRSQSEMEKVGM
jgi:ATP-dependent 26S proteasome regulatory subunit